MSEAAFGQKRTFTMQEIILRHIRPFETQSKSNSGIRLSLKS
jgi:hypothetical protein